MCNDLRSSFVIASRRDVSALAVVTFKNTAKTGGGGGRLDLVAAFE